MACFTYTTFKIRRKGGKTQQRVLGGGKRLVDNLVSVGTLFLLEKAPSAPRKKGKEGDTVCAFGVQEKKKESGRMRSSCGSLRG